MLTITIVGPGIRCLLFGMNETMDLLVVALSSDGFKTGGNWKRVTFFFLPLKLEPFSFRFVPLISRWGTQERAWLVP